jgi:hypothetical protein
VPKSLRPIFRDRDDFAAGHSLTDQTLAALDASCALIVLASPTSAKSRYVNEEIRLFTSRHPDRPVIPVILDERTCRSETSHYTGVRFLAFKKSWPSFVTRIKHLPSTSVRSTKPRSTASSHTVSLGQDVRHASISSV